MEEILHLEKLASDDGRTATQATRVGREARRRQAATKLPDARRNYADALQQRWGAIFLIGEPAVVKEFAEFARVNGPAVVVDAEKVYRNLAKKVDPTMRTDRKLEPSQFGNLMAALATQMKDLGAMNYPAIKYRDGNVLKTFDDLVQYIKNTVRAACGETLAAIFLRQEIGSEALAIRYTREVLPVVVIGADEAGLDGLSGLFGGRVVTVAVDKVDEEAVKQAFGQLKAFYRKPKKEQNQ